jgi:hypothetical protein
VPAIADHDYDSISRAISGGQRRRCVAGVEKQGDKPLLEVVHVVTMRKRLNRGGRVRLEGVDILINKNLVDKEAPDSLNEI